MEEKSTKGGKKWILAAIAGVLVIGASVAGVFGIKYTKSDRYVYREFISDKKIPVIYTEDELEALEEEEDCYVFLSDMKQYDYASGAYLMDKEKKETDTRIRTSFPISAKWFEEEDDTILVKGKFIQKDKGVIDEGKESYYQIAVEKFAILDDDGEIEEIVFANMPDKKTEVAVGDTFTIMLTTGANPDSVEYEGETYTIFNYVVADNDYEDNDRSYKMYDDKKFIVNTDEKMMHMNFDSEIEGIPEIRKDFIKTNVYSAVSVKVSEITEDGIYILEDEKILGIYDGVFSGDIIDIGQCYTIECFYTELEEAIVTDESPFLELNDYYTMLFGADEEVSKMEEKYVEQTETEFETGELEAASEYEMIENNDMGEELPVDADNYYMYIEDIDYENSMAIGWMYTSDSDFYEQENGYYTSAIFDEGLINMLDTESYNSLSIHQEDISWVEYEDGMIPLIMNYFVM